jgi:anti-sigma regulatory factor (Ser/Thr protein kinase)
MADQSTSVDTMTYDEPGDLAAVRAFVRTNAVALGLTHQRADLLTLAVSELTTNTLQHTAGGGRVRVWAEGAQVVCEVRDNGAPPGFGEMPAPESPRGRGLAIVGRVADEVATLSDDGGTVTRIKMNR